MCGRSSWSMGVWDPKKAGHVLLAKMKAQANRLQHQHRLCGAFGVECEVDQEACMFLLGHKSVSSCFSIQSLLLILSFSYI